MRHICHVSVLNPLKHSRIFFRWGLAAVELGYRVSIMAQGDSRREESGIQLTGTGTFNRLSPQRLLFSLNQRKQLLETGADIFVLHSPELLGLGRWLKKQSGAKIIYDAHEDYSQNILHASHYPGLLKKPLSNWVRKLETEALDYLDAVVYAEECYVGMLPAEKTQTYILRNKFVAPREGGSIIRPEAPYMLTTGTLAWPWGIRESFELWKAMCQYKPLHWVVAGHSNDESILDFFENEVRGSDFGEFFTLIGGNTYVDYGSMVELIRGAWFGTGLYHLQPNIAGKIPTKFYEFGALGKPLLFTKEKSWESFNNTHNFGLAVQFGDWKNKNWIEELWKKLEKWTFSKATSNSASFKSEIPTLKSLLEGLYH